MMVETDGNAGTTAGGQLSASGNVTGLSGAGIFPIDKPEGVSSFRMVQLVRRVLGIKKVGHSGTLDPFASGVLIICAGRPATRLIPQLMAGEKEYEATFQLGVITDTQDPEGEVIERRPVLDISDRLIAECLAEFTGEQLQTPPEYSALKHRGKPLYYYARRGIKVEKEPRLIHIRELYCMSRSRDMLTLRVVCSKGTYIRTLAADIGEFLGCGAHLKKLKRTRNGIFTTADTFPGVELLAGDTSAGPLLERYRVTIEEVQELLAVKNGNN